MNKFKILILAAYFITSLGGASKLNYKHTDAQLKKSCFQSKVFKFKMNSIQKEKLCNCVAEKTFVRLKGAVDWTDATKKLFIEQANDFYTSSKTDYEDDSLGAVNSMFDYIDSCSKENKL